MQTVRDDLTRIAAYAASLGYHGILIMSRQCPDCGACHSFEMSTDLGVEGSDLAHDHDISDILTEFAKIARQSPPSFIEDMPGKEHTQ